MASALDASTHALTRTERGRSGARTKTSRLIARTADLFTPDLIARRRERREWERWIDGLTPDLLTELPDASPELKRHVFLANVTRVEIETHAKCNRICSFCPNSIMDRRRNQTVADAAMLDRVFDDLGAAGYQRQICVARYSEPLTNKPYLSERLASARHRVPRAELAITTNTDYLRREDLEKLRDLGLDTMYMSLYLRDREAWTLDLARAYGERVAKKLDLRIVAQHETPVSVDCKYEFEGIRITSTCHNWDQYGIDRGGLVQVYGGRKRVGPCRDPFQTFVIDYNGTVTPCCCVRSDLAAHGRYLMGDLSDPGVSIFDVYVGRLAEWRRGVVAFGEKASPCSTCRHRDIRDDLARPVAAQLEKRLRVIGREELVRPLSSASAR